MRLYELSQQYQQVLDVIEGAEEDFTEEQWDVLIGIEDAFHEKVENIAKLVRSLEVDLEVIKAERRRLSDRQGTLGRKVEWLKAYLLHAMRAVGRDKVKGQLLTVALRNAPVSCDVVDVEALPDDFKRQIVEWKPDRNGINAHFKQTGEVLPGVEMVTGRQYVHIR